jgi:predicted nucleic acid-binding protein
MNKLKVYLDNCCYGRPFDLPSNPTIVFESSAKMLIQTLILNQQIVLVSSFVINEEVLAISNKEKRDLILGFLNNAKIYVASDKTEDVLTLATEIMKTGIKYMDASHIACSIIANSDYLVTTDKRLLKFKSDRISIINPIDFIRIWEEDDHVDE